ncbi:MAG: HDIG domain-containing protein [Thermodesulfobacteriota bacterium]|nr:HDIG domain-containing protein [Thermodesulfobacteriota bacterium]
MIPTREECLVLIERYEMLPHIVRHSKIVTQVALLLGRKLNDCGCDLDLDLVEAGALLHDITKTASIKTKENHAHTGAQLLASLGYQTVADVVRQHITLDPPVPHPGSISEAELVNYADKRVKHDEVVGIEERFQDIKERYVRKFPAFQKRFEEVRQETQLIEKRIFSKIDLSPEQLNTVLFEP